MKLSNDVIKNRILSAKDNWEKNFKSNEETARNFYIGKQWGEEWRGMDRVTTNILIPIVRTITASIWYQNPKITTSPLRPDAVISARKAEPTLNYFFKRMKARDQIELAVLDHLIVRYGLVEVGWKHREKDEKFTEQERAIERETVFEQLLESGEPIPDLNLLEEIVPRSRTIVTKDEPTIERISPSCFFPAPEMTKLEDFWEKELHVTKQEVFPLRLVRNDERFSESVRRKLVPDRLLDNFISRAQWDEEDLQRVTLYYHYFVWDGEIHLAIKAENEDELLYETMSGKRPQPIQFPFAMLKNIIVPDQLEGIGEVEDLMRSQKEINKAKTIIFDHIKRFLRAYLLQKGMDEDGKIKAAFKQPIPANIIEIDDINALKALEDAPVPKDVYEVIKLSMGDVEFRTQLSQYMMGLLPDFKRLATEVNATMQSGGAIMNARLQSVSRFAADIARMLRKELKENLSEDRWIPIEQEQALQIGQGYTEEDTPVFAYGPQGGPPESAMHFAKVGPDAFEDDDYDIEVIVGSSMPLDESVKKKAALDTYNFFAKEPLINRLTLIKDTLEGLGKKNVSDWIAPPPAPPPMPGGIPPEMQQEHGGMMGEPFQRNETALNKHMESRDFTPAGVLRGVRE